MCCRRGFHKEVQHVGLERTLGAAERDDAVDVGGAVQHLLRHIAHLLVGDFACRQLVHIDLVQFELRTLQRTAQIGGVGLVDLERAGRTLGASARVVDGPVLLGGGGALFHAAELSGV